MIHVVAQTPNTLPTTEDQPNPTFVRESILTTPVRDASPSAPDDSVTPEYPTDPNCEHIVDERPFIRAYKGEFQPTYGCSNIISNIIRAKFDEPAPSWLKVSVDLRDRWFGEFKKEYRWHPQEEQAIRAVFETKEEGTSTQDSPNTATFVNDNEICLNVVGGPNYKGNMYSLGSLSIRFSCSKSGPSTSIALEKTLEKKMLQMMENHDHQSQEMRQQMQQQNEQIRQQNEQMQRILQHLHIQPTIPTPSLSPTIADGTDHHVNDAQVDHPHDMENDH
ncbi:hypothetical protein JHK86_055557 [Glycine max]|nr:hypothetical protein JHK86_055557 [Glycine max]